MQIDWLKFSWDLTSVPQDVVAVKPPFVVRNASKDDADAVLRVVTTTFSMDTAWGDVFSFLQGQIKNNVQRALDQSEDPPCLVVLHGARIIGASVLDFSPESINHLVSGPCILHEYHNRGLGSGLLYASLAALRERGLVKAQALTRTNTIGARFVYSKFGGAGEPWEEALPLAEGGAPCAA